MFEIVVPCKEDKTPAENTEIPFEGQIGNKAASFTVNAEGIPNDASVGPQPSTEEPAPQQEIIGATPQARKAGQKIKDLTVERDALIIRNERLIADWDNYKRRTEETKEQDTKRAAIETIEKMFPIMDDLERSVSFAKNADDENTKAFAQGNIAIMKRILDVFAQAGVTPIDSSIGTSFDGTIHKAIGTNTDGKGEPNTIAQTVQRGYMLNGQVVREAAVIVNG